MVKLKHFLQYIFPTLAYFKEPTYIQGGKIVSRPITPVNQVKCKLFIAMHISIVTNPRSFALHCATM